MRRTIMYCVVVEHDMADSVNDEDFTSKFEKTAESCSDDVETMYDYFSLFGAVWASSEDEQKLEPIRVLLENELGSENVKIEKISCDVA